MPIYMDVSEITFTSALGTFLQRISIADEFSEICVTHFH